MNTEVLTVAGAIGSILGWIIAFEWSGFQRKHTVSMLTAVSKSDITIKMCRILRRIRECEIGLLHAFIMQRPIGLRYIVDYSI